MVGQYSEGLRKTITSGTTWVAEDPIFVVGNGTSSTARRNAFFVYKDGSVEVGDHLTINADGTILMSQPQGDISMGQFGSP